MIIAEIGLAHDGSIGIAHSFVDALAETGVDVIKFQTHIAEAESSQHEKFRVNFSYKDNELVLRNLDFDIEEGCQLALVGRTGAGKTSIINILNRFYEIQHGGITIDGVDIKNIKLNNLRNNIAMIQQEVFLFSDTILNNITLYSDSISRERVIDASKEIGIHHFIESLPGINLLHISSLK